MKEILGKTIIALVPYYTEQGANFTKVIFLNNEVTILRKNITSSIKALCSFHYFDLKSSNKTSKEILGISKSPPIAIHKDLVLIAVKTRFPIGKDDGAYSYINTATIEKIQTGRVEFKEGRVLNVLSSRKTIEKNIKYANIIKRTILSRGKSESESKIESSNIAENEDKLSTSQIREDAKDMYTIDYDDFKHDLELIYLKLENIEKTLFK